MKKNWEEAGIKLRTFHDGANSANRHLKKMYQSVKIWQGGIAVSKVKGQGFEPILGQLYS